MSPEELRRRRPLWEAMADLFLDTEVRWFVPAVGWACARSGLDEATLERIFWDEVYPEAILNLLQVAGDWAMLALDEEELIRRAEHGGAPVRPDAAWMVERHWRAALALIPWLRHHDAAGRYQALQLLGYRYFEEPDRESRMATPERLREAGPGVAEAWLVYEPLCRSMLGEVEAATHAARVSAVEALVRAAG